MLGYRRELQATDSCEEALQSIYISNYERDRNPCSCQVIGDQTIVECNQYSYCKECINDSVLNEPLCGEQSNRFVLGVSKEYCVKFGAVGTESNICLSENQQEKSCQVAVDGKRCRSCQHVACEDGSTDFDLDCSNLVNEWGSDPTCQGNSAYNPIAGFTAGTISFEKCYMDPSDTMDVRPSPVSLPTELPIPMPPVSKPTSPVALQDTPAPSFSPITVSTISPQVEKRDSLPTGAIIGAVISSVIVLSLIFCASVWIVKRRQSRVEQSNPRLRVLGRSSKPSEGEDFLETSSCSDK